MLPVASYTLVRTRRKPGCWSASSSLRCRLLLRPRKLRQKDPSPQKSRTSRSDELIAGACIAHKSLRICERCRLERSPSKWAPAGEILYLATSKKLHEHRSNTDIYLSKCRKWE